MKVYKEWKILLVALLASASLLPGCGKSNTSAGGSGAGIAVVATASSTANSGGIAFAIAGNGTNTYINGYTGPTYANLALGAQVSSLAQLNFHRVDGPGDQIQFNATSTSATSTSIAGYVYLSKLTLDTLNGCTLSGAYIQMSNVVTGSYSSGNITGVFTLVTACGNLAM